ncbi:MAG: hypothetical protein P1V51_22080 [Deltaproteobacteria bacterium]|nr:hypothetical protein [Deltaproteobacteria bacterium]
MKSVTHLPDSLNRALGALLLVVVGLLPAAAARASDDLMAGLRERSEAAGVPPTILAGVERELIQAQEAGVSAEALRNKYLEGLAKGVPPAKILVVVRTLRVRIERAARLLAPLASADASRASVRVADALGRGVSPEDVGLLVNRARERLARAEVVAEGTQTLARLREAGLYDPALCEAVGRAVAAGYTEQDLDRLGDDLRRFAANGGDLADFSIGGDARGEGREGHLLDESAGSAASEVPGTEELGGGSGGEGGEDPLAGDRPGTDEVFRAGRDQDPNNPDPPRP